jgi:hypothetical protein
MWATFNSCAIYSPKPTVRRRCKVRNPVGRASGFSWAEIKMFARMGTTGRRMTGVIERAQPHATVVRHRCHYGAYRGRSWGGGRLGPETLRAPARRTRLRTSAAEADAGQSQSTQQQ